MMNILSLKGENQDVTRQILLTEFMRDEVQFI